MIHTWRPWEQSTGPRTAEGKARVARNAYKGDWRGQLRQLRQLLREHARHLGEIEGAEGIGWELR